MITHNLFCARTGRITAICLGFIFSSLSAYAVGIDALAKEESGQPDVSAYLDSKSGQQSRAELVAALRDDDRFVKGGKACELAVQALASVQTPDRTPLLDQPEQIDLLLDASLDTQLSTFARVHVIRRLPIMANTKPGDVEDAAFQLIRDNNPQIVLATLQALSNVNGVDPELSPVLLSIATDPEASIPNAAIAAQQYDQERKANWPGSGRADDTMVTRIRMEAATAWASRESPQVVLDQIAAMAIDDYDIWGKALLVSLVNPKSTVFRADNEVKHAWLDLMTEIVSQPEANRTARCCVAGIIAEFLGRHPVMADAGMAAIDKIAEGHKNDPSVRVPLESLRQLYE